MSGERSSIRAIDAEVSTLLRDDAKIICVSMIAVHERRSRVNRCTELLTSPFALAVTPKMPARVELVAKSATDGRQLYLGRLRAGLK